MRKLAILALCLLTVLLCFSLVSCKDPEDSTAGTENTTPGTDEGTPGTTPFPAESSSTPSDTVEPEVPRVKPEEVTVGRVRVQLLSDSLVRIEQAMTNGKFQDKASFSVINRDKWYKVDYTVATEGENTIIKTADYHVILPTNAANLNGVVITNPKGEELWHYETMTNSDIFLPSPSDELQAWYFTDNPRVIPSENGYGLPADGSYTAQNGWATDRVSNDNFVFLPGGSYETFLKDFIELTGRSEMITMNMLGYWDSRWYAYSATTALKQIQEYKDRGYSIDVLVIDTDWRDASRGVGYEINTKLFPDMADFMKKAHDMGVTIVFNDHPEPAAGTNSLLSKDEIEYRSKNLKLILSLGLDYWWYDRNWSVALKGIDSNLSIYTTGMYAFQWITEDYYNSIADDLDEYARRALIMANVDGIWNGDMTNPTEVAAHKYSIQWTGDIGTSADSLRKEIYNLIYGGAEMGIPYMSSDLGGHTSEVTDDMYVRWMQFGALSTICRVHCTKPYSRMPWLYGDIAESVTKEYVGMRYRLMPLYYALAHENYATGLPVMRRLDIKYPQYAEASRSDEYLLGDYILIAPLAGKGTKSLDGATFTSGDKSGLYVEYFKNKNLTGTPAYTGYDTKLSHDWGDGGPSEIGGLAENFSIRWTGKITAGEKDICLGVYADDGIRIWIDGKLVLDAWKVYDTYMTSTMIEAGSTHDIKIEYFEESGKAHVEIGVMQNTEEERDVFLPEGVWMDVWTGKEYTGPCTITVAHSLHTSPIFVRQGAILPLVSQAVNTFGIDWSKITLDVYPSVNYDAKTTIYEDDTKTVAYKDGKYRTTDVTMDYADGALTIRVGAVKGSFPNAPAFTEREFTVRLHDRANFGKITKITVNGKEVTGTTLKKSSDASPFAETGAALDADVTVVTFKTALNQANEVKVYYESATEDKTNEAYDDSAVKFTVSAEKLTKNSMNGLNLTEKGDLDWALFGSSNPTSMITKKNGKGWIAPVTSDDVPFGFSDNYRIEWSDGDTSGSGSTTNGPVSKRNFRTTLKTDGSAATYTIYLGGYRSVAKITVRDRAGNVQTLTFGNIASNYYRAVTITCEAGEASELAIEYSLLSGDNITFSAITASSK